MLVKVWVSQTPKKLGRYRVRIPQGLVLSAEVLKNEKGRTYGVLELDAGHVPLGALYEVEYDENQGEDYITGDLHLGHRGVLKHRGYDPTLGAAAMDEAILNAINARVREKDRLTLLGDLCLGSWKKAAAYRDRIKCKTVNLILGNHDDDRILKHAEEAGFHWVEKARTLELHGQAIELYHYSQRVWDRMHYGAWHIYGHSHGNLAEHGGKCFDGGWDGLGLLSFPQICEEMVKRKIVLLDHHEPNDEE